MIDLPDYLEEGDEDEFDHLVASRRKAAARPDGGPAPEATAELPVITAAAFAGEPVPPRRWIVQDMIPDRTVSILAGDGGDGKTTLVLQLAAAIAGDRPWLGYNPESGGVLFVSAEDDRNEIHRRLAAIAISLGVPCPTSPTSTSFPWPARMRSWRPRRPRRAY
jgi:AAA domain